MGGLVRHRPLSLELLIPFSGVGPEHAFPTPSKVKLSCRSRDHTEDLCFIDQGPRVP